MKKFKYFMTEMLPARGPRGMGEKHDVKMTYSKVKDGATHHHHVVHKDITKSQHAAGIKTQIAATEKHKKLKSEGWSPHTVGEHDHRTESYGRKVKHTHEE